MTRKSGRFTDRFNVWPGFTDIMVGLLLVFVFVITLFTITQTILSRHLSRKDTELHRIQRELSLKGVELERLSMEIGRLEKLFDAQVGKTSELEQLLAARMRELEGALADVRTKRTLIEEKDKLLEAQRTDIESALGRLQEVTTILANKEKLAADLATTVQQTQEDLTGTRTELSRQTETVSDLTGKIQLLNGQVASLNAQIASYMVEVERLNKLVAESKETETVEKTRASSLQKEIVSLRSRLDEISAKLASAQSEPEREFRLSQLVHLLGQKDQEITQLRQLARYRSEFLAKLEAVFSGVSDIKVQGDRFVFQSEILFASGKTDINESGKAELDKFVHIYKEMVPKIPKGMDMIILVQGHTDVDPVRSVRFKSNWELSAARSMQVVRYLIDKGIPATRLGASALGEFHPVDAESSLAAKRLNRRIEIKITTL
ncbi:MAG TPA: OmpA family protein [Desulfomonilaceae bacterium]|nr:OmpA family protein [Desulfomonilaceae bacterium]